MTTTNSSIQALSSAVSSKTTSGQTSRTSAVSKDEFLQMLVTQLKNQDPMDPMKNDQFAVDLAQFQQLEELMSIDESVKNGLGGDSSSLASYLGRQISFDAETVQVGSHDGGRVRFDLGSDTSNVKVELLNPDGSVAEKLDLGAVPAGRHTAVLGGLQTASGEYKVKITATGLNGAESEIKGQVAGIVTGFVPGADPTLLVGDREIKPADILEVQAVETQSRQQPTQ